MRSRSTSCTNSGEWYATEARANQPKWRSAGAKGRSAGAKRLARTSLNLCTRVGLLYLHVPKKVAHEFEYPVDAPFDDVQGPERNGACHEGRKGRRPAILDYERFIPKAARIAAQLGAGENMINAEGVFEYVIEAVEHKIKILLDDRQIASYEVAGGSDHRAEWSVHQGVRPEMAVFFVLLPAAKLHVSLPEYKTEIDPTHVKENINETPDGALKFVEYVACDTEEQIREPKVLNQMVHECAPIACC